MRKHAVTLLLVSSCWLACKQEQPPPIALHEHEAAPPAREPGQGANGCPDKIQIPMGAAGATYWTDTDGVDPGTPGVHDEWQDAMCWFLLPGRSFGEYCHTADCLVETNKANCHDHPMDIGEPPVFSCRAWCQAPPRNAPGGRCVGNIPSGGWQGPVMSAMCECDPIPPPPPPCPDEAECEGGLNPGDGCDPSTGSTGQGGTCEVGNEEDIFCCVATATISGT